jgi:hypothetical protein
MSNTYFMDESGNSGDLVRAGQGFDFDNQPIFALACVGEDDSAALGAEIDKLKVRHRVGLAELKAEKLSGRPAFLADVLALLRARDAPIFVEAVEKRFMIAIHLVNHQLMTGGHHVGDPMGELLARSLVELIGQAAPTEVLQAFVAACDQPSHASVTHSLRVLSTWGASLPPTLELGTIITGFADLALDEIEPDEEAPEKFGFRRYLPSPDDGPKGKPMWMLAGLSSFTNIYARINLAHRRHLAGVTLVHDDQPYVEQALRDAKATQEVMAASGNAPRVPFADYNIVDSAELLFRRSDQHIGLQVADLIAGIVTRHLKTVLTAPKAPRPLQGVFDQILERTYPQKGYGINFVATDRLLAVAGVAPFPRGR